MDTKPDTEMNSAEHYSEAGFWDKLKDYAVVAGKHLIEKALWLYYASHQPNTPMWAKGVVYSALGYFIFPIDAIPDFTPVVGYADDLGAITAAVSMIAIYIDDEVKALAETKLRHWFG